MDAETARQMDTDPHKAALQLANAAFYARYAEQEEREAFWKLQGELLGSTLR